MRKARYSGPDRSGICVCGHGWKDHHLGLVVTVTKTETDGGPEYYIPQECEFYGSNEDGGKDAEGNPHCDRYQDSLDPSNSRDCLK